MVLPSLVGVSLAVVHPATLMAVDALSFVASALFIRAIRRMLQDPRRQLYQVSAMAMRADIKEGLSFLLRHGGVRTMTIVGAAQCLAGGGFVALLVVWCDRVLGVGTSGWRFGLVYSAWSVGALLASITLPRILRYASPATVALRVIPFSAVLGVVTTFAGRWELAAIGMFCWSIVYTLVVVNTISYRQQVSPEHLLGRVNTAGRMLSWGMRWTLGALAGGALGSAVGVRPAMTTMAALGLVAVAVAWTSPLRGSGWDADVSTRPDGAPGAESTS
ncbi:MAG: hypothetical protein ACR2KG_05250 [Nocardioidaceae bacterium]